MVKRKEKRLSQDGGEKMKNNMKKSVALLTATTMSMSLLTGCSLFKPTAESLLEGCTKKMAKVETMDFDVTMDFGMSMSNGSEEAEINFDLLMEALYQKKAEDEYNVQADMGMEIEMLGMSQSTEAESYIVGKGDTVTTYTKAEDADEWVKEEKDKEESDSMDFDFTSLIGQLTLAEETVMEDGKECFVLEGDVEDNDMNSLLENMDMDGLAEEDMKVHMVMKVDKKEKLPISMTMSVDEEVLDNMFSEEELAAFGDVSVEIDKFEVAIIFNEIGGDITVDVPEEVLDAKEASDDDNDSEAFNFFNSPSGDSADDADDLDDMSEDDADDLDDLLDDEADDLDDTLADDEEDLDDTLEDDTDDLDDSLEDIEVEEDSISKEDFEAAGYECQEFSSEDGVYLLVANNNSSTKDVEVYAYFKKGDDIVDWSYEGMTMEGGSEQVVDFASSDDYDSIMYTFVERDTEGYKLVGEDLVITYDIDEEGHVTGTITNNSNKTISYAQAHVVLMNKDNEVIEHEYAFAEETEMEPASTQNFEMYIDHVDYDSIQIYGIANIDD